MNVYEYLESRSKTIITLHFLTLGFSVLCSLHPIATVFAVAFESAEAAIIGYGFVLVCILLAAGFRIPTIILSIIVGIRAIRTFKPNIVPGILMICGVLESIVGLVGAFMVKNIAIKRYDEERARAYKESVEASKAPVNEDEETIVVDAEIIE